MYAKYFKRILDVTISFSALIILSPLFLILTILGFVFMRGNPFFIQEQIFKLIKYRTMDNQKNINGELLSDEIRLNKYGKFLRASSLDELPELINIFKGEMSIVGPRPLLVKYIPLYNEEQHHRHDVRPGLTGYAQAHGRNSVSWEDKFKMDLDYIEKITFAGDMKLILKTIAVVFQHENIDTGSFIVKNGVVFRPLDVERGEKSEN